MKRTCEGCKALGISGCNLGHKTENVTEGIHVGDMRPMEGCAKPITNSDYRLLMRLKKKLIKAI